MRKTFQVVDDFYRNPMAYRERALKSSLPARYAEESSGYRAPRMEDVLEDEAAQRIFQILGWRSDGAPRVMICGYFTFGREDVRELPAMQLESFSWAGLLCLSLLESHRCGIGFYRREHTTPRDLAPLATSGGPARLGDSRSRAAGIATASGHDGVFRLTIDVPMRFNRMVLFQTSALGYGVSPSFEQACEPGPLVQLLTFGDEPSHTK